MKNKGSTLIEVLIYMALYGIIIGGVAAGVYSLFESSGRNQAKTMVQEEGVFLTGKIDWALTGAKAVNVSATGGQLFINREGIATADNPLTFDTSGGNMELAFGSGAPERLNNTNTNVTDAVFIHTLSSGDGVAPESIKASFTLTTITAGGQRFSQNFSTVKFLRK